MNYKCAKCKWSHPPDRECPFIALALAEELRDDDFLARRRELQKIDASTVTLAIQDPHLGTVRSMQTAGAWQFCEFIDGIDAPETVIMDCVAIDENLRRRGVKR